jgi:hypothetical protein
MRDFEIRLSDGRRLAYTDIGELGRPSGIVGPGVSHVGFG